MEININEALILHLPYVYVFQCMEFVTEVKPFALLFSDESLKATEI